MKNLIYILAFLPLFCLGQFASTNDDAVKVYGQDSTIFSGDVNSQGYVIPSKYIHSNCYRGESTILFTITSAETWYHLTNATNDLFVNCELNGMTMTNDTLTIDSISGGYNHDFHLNFIGTPNKNYKCRIYNITKDVGVPVGDAQAGAGTDIVSIDPSGYQHGDVGDKYIIQIQNADGTDDLTIKSLKWSVQFLYKE